MTNQQSPERVTSDPVPVPAPADDADRERDADREQDTVGRERDATEGVTDRVPEEALDDRDTFEDPTLAGERSDPDDLTAVRPEYHEPEQQRTAFGAATVGGAVAAAAQAGPSHEVRDREDAEEAEGAAGDPVPAPAAEERAEPVVDADQTAAAVDAPAEGDRAPAVEEPVAGLWGEGTAQGYRDRWREVQLRFIDDPPAAAREANQLVEEAVGALTAELSRQKEALRGYSGEDTEELRSVVRRHRDFLERLLGL